MDDKAFNELRRKYTVSADECDRIYRETIFPHVQEEIRQLRNPPNEPMAVYIGGQAGAGKSYATRSVGKEFGDILKIDIDKLREEHPAYEYLVEHEPLLMPAFTNQFAKDMANRITKHCEDTHTSFMREGTWKDSEDTISRMQHSKDAGMRVQAVVVAVPPALSSMGTVYRYCSAKETKERLLERDPNAAVEQPRWADWKYQQGPLDKLGGTIKAVADSGVADGMMVFNRERCLARMTSQEDMRHRAQGTWEREFHRHLSDKEMALIDNTVREAEDTLDPNNPAEEDLIRQFDEMCKDISIGGKYSTGDVMPAVEERAITTRRVGSRKGGRGKDNHVGETCDVTGHVKSNGVKVRSYVRRIGSPGPRSGKVKS